MDKASLSFIDWPKSLNRVLAGLERTTHQCFHEFRTDSGHVLRRPKTTPFPVFKGMVELKEAEKSELHQFFLASQGHHIRFNDPKTGAEGYAVFMQRPILRTTHLVVAVPGTASYTYELLLRDTTELAQTLNQAVSAAAQAEPAP